MNQLTTWALGRPVAVSMVFVCLFVTGLVGGQRLPLEFLPDIEWPALWVQIPYRNASPEEVERRITRPAEDALATLGGIDSMRSTSDSEGSSLFLRFDWQERLAHKSVEVRDRLEAQRARFPDGADRIIVRRFEAGSLPVLSLRLAADRDLSTAHALLERHFVRGLERLPGVARAELFGVQPRQLRVQLSAERMAAHRIDLEPLAARLRAANFQRSGGRIDSAGQRWQLRLDGQLQSVEAVAALPIRDDGLRLGDIAEVALLEAATDSGRRLDGRPAAGLNIFKASGANLVAVADAVLAELETLRSRPELAGLQVDVSFNAADDVRRSLADLVDAGLWGALLAFLVLLAFVRDLRMTLLVTAAVPLSLVVTLGVMYFAGFSLNVLTLTGLMLSIGMLVDNAVVVSESVHSERGRGLGAVLATRHGVGRVALAVVAGTATTAIVFLPNIFGEQNNVTVYLSHVAITITVSLAASLAVALLLVPQLTARLPAPRPAGWLPRWLQRLPHSYARLLAAVLARRGSASLVLLLFLGSIALPARWVGVELFPPNESEQLKLRYSLDGRHALATVSEEVGRIDDWLLARREALDIASVYSYFSSSRAETTIRLKPEGERRLSPAAIRSRIEAGLPSLTIGRAGFEVPRMGQADATAVQLVGESAAAVAALAQQLLPLLRALPEIADAQAPELSAARELRIRVQREGAQRFGLGAQQVAERVSSALRGADLRPFRTASGELDSVLELREADRADLDALQALPLTGADGRSLTLSQVAELEIGEAATAISRQDRQTGLQLEFTAAAGVTSTEARAAVAALLEHWRFEPGYGWRFGRAFDREAESLRILLTNLALALALIYLVMAALFESWLAPAAIVSSVAFAVVGVFWFFAATGTAFTVMALIGVLVLMGIVVNNGIVLLDLVQRLRREGLARHDALLQAGRDRLRPIVMTALTTILGMLPLALGGVAIGGDGPPYFPMARAVIGGLATATVVSLLALPLVYTLLDDLALWLAGLRQALREDAAEAGSR